jgi:hypothetical protein
MAHPLVTQLRFARSEFQRCLAGVTAEEAICRVGQLNCLSWIVGRLAAQENYLWVVLSQGEDAAPGLSKLVGYGQPASTPPWDGMRAAWRQVTAAADRCLDGITGEMLGRPQARPGEAREKSIGTTLLRNTYHYWFHPGEAHAVRQLLGHTHLSQFVGNMREVGYQNSTG